MIPFKLEIYAIDGPSRSVTLRVEITTTGVYTLGRSTNQSIRLDNPAVSREHLELDVSGESITVRNLSQSNGTFIDNSKIVSSMKWDTDKVLQIGKTHEVLFIPSEQDEITSQSGPIEIDPSAQIFVTVSNEKRNKKNTTEEEFEAIFDQGKIIEIEDIVGSKFYSGQTEFAALGAGIGSFVWVNSLRNFGIAADRIVTIGDNNRCYANYERYCKNSQIPLYERLRSNSASTPDNMWGFPGYASREFAHSLFHGPIDGLKGVFAVFGEPFFAQSYVPTADHVFRSLDKEMIRIGWKQMFQQGRIFKVRKTSDGRYAIGYKTPRSANKTSDEDRFSIHVARIIHAATGYPSINLVQDLAQFLVKNPDRRSLMVNAYEPHEQVYEKIRELKSATVIIRGRGIVASRILQKLAEERKRHRLDLVIIHLMRGQRRYGTGATFRRTRRPVFNDVEVQPFNWPKACWSGSLRRDIEEMGPVDRSKTYGVLGGTSTAIRKDWTELIERGTEEGWYQKIYGTLSEILPDDSSSEVNFVVERTGKVRKIDNIFADFIIDCTGLIADISLSPFLNDLINTYSLERNVERPATDKNPAKLAGLTVTDDFEVRKMNNNGGRLYVSGQLAGGGPYAPVDSFLGLQYAALRSVDNLSTTDNAVPTLGPIKSMAGWVKWCIGTSP